MAQAEKEFADEGSQERQRRGFARWRVRFSLLILAILIGFSIYGWSQRKQIADDYIGDELRAMGLDATYDVERIGGTRQVLSNLVIGDPANPDFTAERVSIILNYGAVVPTIGRIELDQPRLYGSFHGGELSFGSLDKVIFAETEEPPGLPDLDLLLVDGRGLIDSEFGPIGLFLDGEGELDSGFRGELAGSAPRLRFDGCAAESLSFYGSLTTNAGRPNFSGPVRLAALSCPEREFAVRDADITAQITGDRDLAGIEMETRLVSRSLRMPGLAANGVNGSLDAVYRDGRLNSRYNLAVRGGATEFAGMAVLTAEGAIRATEGFENLEVQAEVEGNGLRFAEGFERDIARFEASGSENLLGPLVGKLRRALQREARGSRLEADITVRSSEQGSSFVVPEARLSGGSGATLLSVSRLQVGTDADGNSRFLGNFSSGGEGLPRLVGRMERRGEDTPLFRLQMAEYRAGDASLAIPELVIAQSDSGQLGFAGTVTASGPLPGGRAEQLRVPIDGLYSQRAGLQMWRRCTEFGFERLELANLALERKGLRLCPSSAGAILRNDGGGLRIEAGAPSLDLSGSVGETPIEIRSGPIGFAYPGVLSARDVDILLGPGNEASRFKVSNVIADIGDGIDGSFNEADVRLFAVPMNLLDAAGSWRYANGEFAISDSSFRLVDREEEERFRPLIARDGTLSLIDNVITANATLREPSSDRAVTDVAIVHNLETSRGHADIDVAGIRFDNALQPDDLSPLALGVIANAEGVVTGSGRFEWAEDEVTSSGSFSTEGLDFAAAFGPVEGASGTIEFVDLINLTTAAGQRLKVRSINPGIEVFDGEIEYDLKDGTALSLAGGTWPFLGGTLKIQPVNLNFGAEEVRRYILVIEGMEASQFVERMELGNISATGIFDGTIPLVFDEDGNGRIEGGLLIARPPGGNLSYVGELTYEDLSAIANFAFDTLRSLDYSEMEVRMDGSLTGEIVTKIRFDGVKQGEGARSNILTRRIAKLPIHFNVNISAPFYQLITSFKAMYDPAFVRDPRELGSLTDDGERLQRSVTGTEVRDEVTPAEIIPDEPSIQSPESESPL